MGLDQTVQSGSDVGNLQGNTVKRSPSWGLAGRILLGVVTFGLSEGVKAYTAYRASKPADGRVSQLDEIARAGLGGISLDQNRSPRLRELDALSNKEIATFTPDQLAAMSDDEKAAVGLLFGNKEKLSFGEFAGQRVDVWLLNLKRQRGEPIHPPSTQPATPVTSQTNKQEADKSLKPTNNPTIEAPKGNIVFDTETRLALEQVRSDCRDGRFEPARKGCEEAIAKIEAEYGKSDLRLWDFKQILAESFDAEGNRLEMINTLSEMSDLVEANEGKPGNSEKAGYTFHAWATYSKRNDHTSQYEKYTHLALKAFEADLKERDGGDTRQTKKSLATLNHRLANQLGRKGDFNTAIRHAEAAHRLRLEEHGQFDKRTVQSSDLVQGLKRAKMEAFLAEPDGDLLKEGPISTAQTIGGSEPSTVAAVEISLSTLRMDEPAPIDRIAKSRFEAFLAEDANLDQEVGFKPIPIGVPRAGFPNVTGNSCFMNSTIKSVIASSGASLDNHLSQLEGSGTLGDRTQAFNAFRNLVQASRQGGIVSNSMIETFQSEMLALKKPNGNPLLSGSNYFELQQDANDFREILNDTFGLDRLAGHTFDIVETASRDGEMLPPNVMAGSGFTLAPRDNALERLAVSANNPVPLARYKGSIEDLVKEAMGEQLGELAGDVYRTTRTDFQGDWNTMERMQMRLAQGDGQSYFDFRSVDFDAGFAIKATDTASATQHDIFLQPSEIVCHSGTDGAGHYFTYAKAPDGNGWWLHNDSQVTWTATISDPSMRDIAFRPVSINFAVTDLGPTA